jgi:hypothetical protein
MLGKGLVVGPRVTWASPKLCWCDWWAVD